MDLKIKLTKADREAIIAAIPLIVADPDVDPMQKAIEEAQCHSIVSKLTSGNLMMTGFELCVIADAVEDALSILRDGDEELARERKVDEDFRAELSRYYLSYLRLSPQLLASAARFQPDHP